MGKEYFTSRASVIVHALRFSDMILMVDVIESNEKSLNSIKLF